MFIDEYGKLNNDVSEIELENHVTNIIKEYKSIRLRPRLPPFQAFAQAFRAHRLGC